MNKLKDAEINRNFYCTSAGSVVIENCNGTTAVDLDAHQLAQGRIWLEGEIDYKMADAFSSGMKYLADEQMPAEIYINSPGGEVFSGLMIYDIIQDFPYQVDIYCMGLAASMAAIILAGGRKGHRFILPHSRVMIHEPLISGGMGGSATTIEKTAQSILETRKITNGIIAKHTGKTIEEINKATVFDNFMFAEEAVKFGICDEIKNIF